MAHPEHNYVFFVFVCVCLVYCLFYVEEKIVLHVYRGCSKYQTVIRLQIVVLVLCESVSVFESYYCCHCAL